MTNFCGWSISAYPRASMRLAFPLPQWFLLLSYTSKCHPGVPVVAQRKRIWLASMRTQVWDLALISGLRIQCCHELWCRLKMWLRSGIAVAVVCRPAAVAPIGFPAWEPPCAAGMALKKKEKKKGHQEGKKGKAQEKLLQDYFRIMLTVCPDNWIH